MHFSKTLFGLAASAAAVNAASVTFRTLDGVARTVYFTPSPGSDEIAPVTVDKNGDTNVTLPDSYQGNFYALREDQEHKPGMLGEIKFGGWQGITFFDVSAIVDPTDDNNVKQMWPVGATSPMSGCEKFPCPNVYVNWDDVQTKATNSKHLMTTLGAGSVDVAFAN